MLFLVRTNVAKLRMQTQEVSGLKRYIDQELYARVSGRCEVWYLFYANEIQQWIADAAHKKVVGLQIQKVKNVFGMSLSELKNAILAFDNQGDEFQQTHVIIVDSKYTFVPDALFDAAEAPTYLQLVHAIGKLQSTYFDRKGEMVIVYPVNDLFYNAVRLVLPGMVMHHYTGMLAETFALLSDKKQPYRVQVHFAGEGMDIFYFKDNKLFYHNYFPFESDTDVVYFLLSVAEILSLPSDNWEVMLSGEIAAENSLIQLMKKYIPRVVLAKRPDVFDYPAAFREFQEQNHFAGLSAILCAS